MRIATRQTVGGRLAHQMCSRFWGGRCLASLSDSHSADSDEHGKPASIKDGFVLTNRSDIRLVPFSLMVCRLGGAAWQWHHRDGVADRRRGLAGVFFPALPFTPWSGVFDSLVGSTTGNSKRLLSLVFLASCLDDFGRWLA